MLITGAPSGVTEATFTAALEELQDVTLAIQTDLANGADLSPTTLSALEQVTATVMGMPTDYPDAGANTKLQDVKDLLAALIIELDENTAEVADNGTLLSVIATAGAAPGDPGYMTGLYDVMSAIQAHTGFLSSIDTVAYNGFGNDTGTPPSGGTGVRGWLRGIYDKISLLPTTAPQTDALTNTQLRATPVPVSGTFYQATQPVSAASLPLPAGAATDAKLTTIQNQLEQPLTTASTATPLTSGNVILPATLCTGSFAVVYFYRTAAASNAQVRIQFSPNGVDNWATGGRLAMTSVNDAYSFADITSSTVPVVAPVIGKYIRLIAGTSFTGVGTLESSVFFTNADPMGGAPRPVSQSGTWTVVQGVGASVSPWRVSGVAPQTTLNNAAAVGNGTGVDVLACSNATAGIIYTGTPGSISLILQGSNDNVTYFDLTTTTTTSNHYIAAPVGVSFRFYRVRVAALTGTTSIVAQITAGI